MCAGSELAHALPEQILRPDTWVSVSTPPTTGVNDLCVRTFFIAQQRWMDSPSSIERRGRKMPLPFSCFTDCRLPRECMSRCFRGLPIATTLIAPDYPGFGHSDWPDPTQFAYTFDRLAEIMNHFTDAIALPRYTLYMQDYGGPVGFRMALSHPERINALIVQNAVAHNEGLGAIWKARRAFWADRAANEKTLRTNLLSLATTRTRHVGEDPNVERYDPDLWTDEFAFLNQPGQAEIQSDLFYDYRTNVDSYPKWQAWLREKQPRLLVIWGKFDPSFALFRTRSISSRRAERPSSRSRRGSFCVGHRCRRDRCVAKRVCRRCALAASALKPIEEDARPGHCAQMHKGVGLDSIRDSTPMSLERRAQLYCHWLPFDRIDLECGASPGRRSRCCFNLAQRELGESWGSAPIPSSSVSVCANLF